MPPEENSMHGKITRRGALKRIGAGAAIAWSAPALTSLGSRAFAQEVRTPRCSEECGRHCGDATNCGEAGPFNLCVCSETTEGNCFCGEVSRCSDITRCSDSTDCAANERCTEICGCGGGLACIPECGTGGADASISDEANTADL